MKIIIDREIDKLYLEELKEISKIRGDTIEETLKTAISCFHKEWKDKGLI